MEKSLIYILSCVGVVVLAVGLILEWYGNEKIILYAVQKKTELVEGSESMVYFKKIPQPFYIKVYFYNVSNPEGVGQGEKPKITEIGPYVYDQWREKLNIKYDLVNGTVSYLSKKTYYFNPKLSRNEENVSLSDTDQVTILNMPLMGALLTLEQMDPSLASFFDPAIPQLFNKPTSMFVTATVKDLLFDGVLMNCTTKDMITSMICSNMGAQLPDTVRPDGKNFKFSFLYGHNTTAVNVTTVYNGVKDPSKLNHIKSVGNTSAFTAWTEHCNMMNGTDSAQFQPNINNFDKVYVFEPDFCVSLYAERESERVYEGLDVVRFVTKTRLLGAAKDYPENKCYCIKLKNADGVDEEHCPAQGTLNLHSCIRTQLIISFPHFYLADSELRNFSGISSPVKELHQTFVDVEKYTGFPVNGSKRLQFNMMIKQMDEITLLTNISEGLVPIIWMEEGTELNKENLETLKQKLELINILKIGTIVAIAGGIIVIVFSYVFYAKHQKMLCFEGELDHSGATNKVHVAQNGAANGTYSGKINTVTLYEKSITSQHDGAGRKQSNNNSVAYMENFM